MCDGVTQGQPGMELSLFCRDVIAHGDRRGAVPRHVRRRPDPRHLRQDRAGPGDRRPDLRPSAGDLRARRADDHPACPTPRSRASASSTPRARSAATSCWRPRSQVLPRPRHLHLLRHRQLQPDADGDHGPAPAGRLLRQPEHAAARRADRGRRDARAPEITALGNDYTPIGAGDRRARHRQRRRRPAWRPAARPTTRSTWSPWRGRPASS